MISNFWELNHKVAVHRIIQARPNTFFMQQTLQ